jgi:hypothetical protein
VAGKAGQKLLIKSGSPKESRKAIEKAKALQRPPEMNSDRKRNGKRIW